jgi:hypothetical protein
MVVGVALLWNARRVELRRMRDGAVPAAAPAGPSGRVGA